MGRNALDALPVVREVADFDPLAGSRLERLIFNHRVAVVIACALVTALLALQATTLRVNAGFEKMMPQGHPYIRNFVAHQTELRGLGNAIRVVVENPSGTVFEPGYLATLKQINDELFLTPGVDRAWMKSLWTPAVRWTQATEEGFEGGPVMPEDFDASPGAAERLRENIARAGIVGSLVGNDFRSSMVFVPLLDRDPGTGKRLDYRELSRMLEENVRAKYGTVRVRIIGFAKLAGDLIDGLMQVMTYFLAAGVIAAGLVFLATRCARSTLLILACSLVAVVWQLGLVALLGFEMDPISILVPFLIFAIGVSHGAQKMNGILQDVARGTHRLVAARYTFRRLFVAGFAALTADAAGFAALMAIDIPVIREIALTASLGVAALIVTNLILLPVLLSYTGVSAAAAARSIEAGRSEGLARSPWDLLVRITEPRRARVTVGVFAMLTALGLVASSGLRIGDLDPGAPELRGDSRYNLDNAYITAHYALSSDVFAVIVRTPVDGCLQYRTLVEADRLAWTLQQLPGVQATLSLADAVRNVTAGSFEGSPKWLTINRNQKIINYGGQQASVHTPDLFNGDCTVTPVIAYLADHKADTLDGVAASAQAFADAHDTPERRFLLAAGTAGIEAATNSVVRRASWTMLLAVYAAVIALCFITFRSWRAVVVAVVPLAITSILCEALMVALGIGVKVATLPVIALGVGIGVDYALYLLSVQLAEQRRGRSLEQAYRYALRFTGKVVALVGLTLAVGVATWAWSPIKFQADMGILLTFMFLWNMVGALVLIPALSHFLLRHEGQAGAAS